MRCSFTLTHSASMTTNNLKAEPKHLIYRFIVSMNVELQIYAIIESVGGQIQLK